MPNANPYTSVIVPTRNGMPLVERCLRAVLAQEAPWPFEVVVIDSESNDGTWELLETFPVQRTRIPVGEFNHGATRNRAVQQTGGEYLVFLVQDAVPADSRWLQRLVCAAETPGAAGSYSLQLNWPLDNALVRLHTEQALPQGEDQLVQRLDKGQSWSALTPEQRFGMATFRNNASCMRREVWTHYPFHALPYGEDLEWGERVVRAGYAIVYEPESRVYHSHDRSSFYELKRAYADHELVMRVFGYCAFPRLRGLVASWVKNSAQAMRAILLEQTPPSERLLLAARAPVVIGARHLGSYLGARAGGRGPKQAVWQRLDTIMRRGV